MIRIITLAMVICLVLFCLQCAGPKKLTPDEFENLSPQERVTYLEEYVRKNKTDIESMKLLEEMAKGKPIIYVVSKEE